jgi:hypothetical protein
VIFQNSDTQFFRKKKFGRICKIKIILTFKCDTYEEVPLDGHETHKIFLFDSFPIVIKVVDTKLKSVKFCLKKANRKHRSSVGHTILLKTYTKYMLAELDYNFDIQPAFFLHRN